jgi:hypothetical protein
MMFIDMAYLRHLGGLPDNLACVLLAFCTFEHLALAFIDLHCCSLNGFVFVFCIESIDGGLIPLLDETVSHRDDLDPKNCIARSFQKDCFFPMHPQYTNPLTHISHRTTCTMSFH